MSSSAEGQGDSFAESESTRLAARRTYRKPVTVTLTLYPGPESWVKVSQGKWHRWVPGHICILDVVLRQHGW